MAPRRRRPEGVQVESAVRCFSNSIKILRVIHFLSIPAVDVVHIVVEVVGIVVVIVVRESVKVVKKNRASALASEGNLVGALLDSMPPNDG